jgi:hypothetical protein
VFSKPYSTSSVCGEMSPTGHRIPFFFNSTLYPGDRLVSRTSVYGETRP